MEPVILEYIMQFTHTFVYDIKTIAGVRGVSSLDQNNVDGENLWKINLHSNKYVAKKLISKLLPMLRLGKILRWVTTNSFSATAGMELSL